MNRKFSGFLVYIAGPYRDREPYQVYNNIQTARDYAVQVVKAGAYPIVPHKCTEAMEGLNSSDFFLEGTLEAMSRCDAVLVLPGFGSSEGTLGEIKEAKRLRIPILYSIPSMYQWIRENEES